MLNGLWQILKLPAAPPFRSSVSTISTPIQARRQGWQRVVWPSFFFCLSAQSRMVMMIIPLPHYGNNFVTKFFVREKNVSESTPPPPPHWAPFAGLLQCSARHFAIPPPKQTPWRHPSPTPPSRHLHCKAKIWYGNWFTSVGFMSLDKSLILVQGRKFVAQQG